jgi:hypothetical protein
MVAAIAIDMMAVGGCGEVALIAEATAPMPRFAGISQQPLPVAAYRCEVAAGDGRCDDTTGLVGSGSDAEVGCGDNVGNPRASSPCRE